MPVLVTKISDNELRILREWLRTFGQSKRWHVHQVKIALHSVSRRARELARERCLAMYREMLEAIEREALARGIEAKIREGLAADARAAVLLSDEGASPP